MPDRDDLSEFKELLGDGPPVEEDGDEYSLDAIMAEYKYEAVTTRRRPAARDEKTDSDTARIRQISETMKELTRERPNEQPAPPVPEPAGSAAPLSETPAPAPPASGEYFFASGDFEKAFTPSSAYVRRETEAEADELNEQPPAAPRVSFAERLKKYVRRRPPAADETPERAAARLAPYLFSLRARTLLAFILFVPLLYVSLAQPYGWPLPGALTYASVFGGSRPYIYLLVTGLLQLLMLFCAVDVLARGFSDLLHLRPGGETLVALNAVASLAQLLSVAALDGFTGYLPYTAASGGIVLFAMIGQTVLCTARLRTYRTAAASKSTDVVLLEEGLWEDLSGYTRRPGSTEGFVARVESPDLVHKTVSTLAPLMILAPLVLALAATVGRERPQDFFWAWSALSCAVVPFGTLSSFALPFSRAVKRLAHMGVAVAGWPAAHSFSSGSFAVVTDGDLFPHGTITLNGLKVIGHYSYERVTAAAASLLAASGTGLYAVVQDLTRETRETLRRVTSFEHYEGGGVGGEIDGDRALLGSASFMLRMGIRLPKELNIKNAVFIALNLNIAGIFAVNYIAAEGVENALHLFERQKVTPVLAVRDFNITPAMLKQRFGINADTLEYPPIEDRLALSDPTRETPARPAAIITRDGLNPYAESVICGRQLYRTTRINLFIHLLSAVGGLLLMFYFAYVGTAEAALSITPGNVLLFLFLWWLPIWIISSAASRY